MDFSESPLIAICNNLLDSIAAIYSSLRRLERLTWSVSDQLHFNSFSDHLRFNHPQDSIAAIESSLRRLERLMPGYDLHVDGKLLEQHVWHNFTACLDESRR